MKTTTELKASLRNVFKGELLDDSNSVTRCANDASIFEFVPILVAKPKDAEDIKTLVSTLNTQEDPASNLSITARAAGTGMAGGALTESIVLDVMNLNTIKSITDSTAVVEPGVYYRDLEKQTLAINRIMPSYPASKNICAVGGMVNTNASGEKTLIYGSTDRYVKKLKVVLSDGNEYTFEPLSKNELDEKMKLESFEGELYRSMFNLLDKNYEMLQKARPQVSKNSTGYALWNIWDKETFDFTKLFVGSEGTLGITTEITFDLVEPKPKSKLLVIFVKDLAPLPSLVQKVLAHKPESFESYDDNTFKFAIRFFPDIVKSMKTGLFSLMYRFLPEFSMIIRGGVPKLILLAEFTGTDDQEILARAEAAQKDIASFGFETKISTTKEDAEKYWTIRRESFNLLRHHGGKKRTVPVFDDIVVDPNKLPEFLPRLTELMDGYKLVYTIAGHIGDGNFHIIPLMDLRKAKERSIVLELAQKVFALVFEFGGSMSGEHNDGVVRTPFLRQMYGDDVYHLFEKTKNIFDPKHIFNPGKKVFGGEDLQRLQDHIDRVY